MRYRVITLFLPRSEKAAVLCQLSDLKAFLDGGNTVVRVLGSYQTEEVAPPRAVGPAEPAPDGREEQFEEEEDFEGTWRFRVRVRSWRIA